MSPRTGSAAAPGAGPSPGSSRGPGSAGPAGHAAPSRGASASSDRQHVGGAVGEPHPRLGGGDLHHRLGVVGDRMVHRLVRGRDPERRAVVVGAVVQPAHRPSAAWIIRATVPCRRRRGRPAASRPGSRTAAAGPAARTPPPARAHASTIAATCSSDVTFGQRDHEPSGRPPASTSVPRNRSSVRSPRRRVGRLERLDPDAAERRSTPASPASTRARAAATARVLLRRRRGRRSRPRGRSAGPRSARVSSLASTRCNLRQR